MAFWKLIRERWFCATGFHRWRPAARYIHNRRPASRNRRRLEICEHCFAVRVVENSDG